MGLELFKCIEFDKRALEKTIGIQRVKRYDPRRNYVIVQKESILEQIFEDV